MTTVFGVFTIKSFLEFSISALKFLKILGIWGLVSYKTVYYKKMSVILKVVDKNREASYSADPM